MYYKSYGTCCQTVFMSEREGAGMLELSPVYSGDVVAVISGFMAVVVIVAVFTCRRSTLPLYTRKTPSHSPLRQLKTQTPLSKKPPSGSPTGRSVGLI